MHSYEINIVKLAVVHFNMILTSSTHICRL